MYSDVFILFQGCIFHGCPECFPDRKLEHPRTKATMEVLYVKTMKKKTELRLKGYKYVCIWGHDFHKLKRQPEVKEFLSTLDIQRRLDPRDSFFGGRTNATTLHYKVKEGETIQYVDFCR